MAEEAVEVLLERIQRHLDARVRQAPAPASVTAMRSRVPQSFVPAVYEHLEEAEAVMEGISVQPFLTPLQMPLIGRLWQRLRAAAHQLVVFYVNRLAGAQGAFNREIFGTVAALVEDLDRARVDRDAEIAALRAEVQALRDEVASLRARAGEEA